jgi:hypothetical protein
MHVTVKYLPEYIPIAIPKTQDSKTFLDESRSVNCSLYKKDSKTFLDESISSKLLSLYFIRKIQ